MKRILIFTLLFGTLLIVSNTLSYFYDVEGQRGVYTSGFWASKIYPTADFVRSTENDVYIEFSGKPDTEYNFSEIFRILDAPGEPTLSMDGIDFVDFSKHVDINDWVVGMHISQHSNGTYTGTLTIDYQSYPYTTVEIPVKITLEE